MPFEAAENIYRAAIHLFAGRGYPSTSMRDISSAVGVLPGSLYTHITSKEALLLQIVERGIRKYLDAVVPVAASSEPADRRLRQAIKAHVDVVANNIELSVVTFHQWKYLSNGNRRHVVDLRNTYEDLFVRIVDDGIRAGVFGSPGNSHLLVLAVLGVLNWVPEWFSPSGPKSADQVGDELANVVLLGLMGLPRSSAIDVTDDPDELLIR